jgi:hypothetical protein
MGWDGMVLNGWDELVFMKTRAIDKDSCRGTRMGREIRGDGWMEWEWCVCVFFF